MVLKTWVIWMGSTGKEGGNTRARDIAGNDDGSLWCALAAATSTRRRDSGAIALRATSMYAIEAHSATIHGVTAAGHRRANGTMLAVWDQHVDDRGVSKTLPALFTEVVSMGICMDVPWRSYVRRLRGCVCVHMRAC
jgi:hypothetical protein